MASTDENVARVKQLTLRDRRMALRKLTEKSDILHETCRPILKDRLEVRWLTIIVSEDESLKRMQT